MFFKKLSITSKYIIYGILILYVLFLILGLVITNFVYPFEKPIPYIVGLSISSFISVIKIILLERALENSFSLEDSEKAQGYSSLQYLLRSLLTILLAVIIIIFPDKVGLFGSIFGIFFLQFGAYIANYLLKKFNPILDPTYEEAVDVKK